MIEVKAFYNEESKKIKLELTNDKNTQVIEASVRASGIFKFSYHHPELKKADVYHGVFLSKAKFMIYPILGKGVISDQPIEIEQ